VSNRVLHSAMNARPSGESCKLWIGERGSGSVGLEFSCRSRA
jgi:hypothetical protein